MRTCHQGQRARRFGLTSRADAAGASRKYLDSSQRNRPASESVAKAKAINKYLGSSYKLLASYGRVRDLPC